MIAAILIIVFLLVLVLFMIKPAQRRFTEFPAPLFAHRGLHGRDVPENSLAAFKKARQRTLGVELDVRFTLDKKLVVFHDDNLKRICGENRKVNALTWEELNHYPLSGTSETIPLFNAVLKELDGMPVICEIKSLPGEPVAELCESVCREIAGYKGFICIESFNPMVLQWFRKYRPDIIRGQLSMNFMQKKEKLPLAQAFVMTHLLVNVLSRPDFIAYHFSDDSVGFVLCRKLFRPVCVAWTVKNEKDKNEAMGIYQAFIFEEN